MHLSVHLAGFSHHRRWISLSPRKENLLVGLIPKIFLKFDIFLGELNSLHGDIETARDYYSTTFCVIYFS